MSKSLIGLIGLIVREAGDEAVEFAAKATLRYFLGVFLWAEYETLLRPRTHVRMRANNIDEAIDSIVDEGNLHSDDDEFELWKRSKPVASKGSEAAKNPVKNWISLRDRYPNLSKLAHHILSIPASSC